MSEYKNIDQKYISSEIVFDGSKTTIKITIDKEAISENAKRVHISYMYVNEKSADQPKPGTVQSVGTDIVIDENTQFPITGEFEIDGAPQSVEGTIKKMVTYRIAQASIYDIGFDGTSISSDAVTNDAQAEFLAFNDWNSPGGIAIKGSHYE